jgi:hypothetical protein
MSSWREQQRELVAALTTGAAAPAGFDASRLSATAASLARKRRRSVARAWPSLARALGQQFVPLFAEYAASHNLPALNGPLADGFQFAEFLQKTGRLPAAAKHDLLAVKLRFAPCEQGLVPRRYSLVAGWLPGRGPVLGVRMPQRPERWLAPLAALYRWLSRP